MVHAIDNALCVCVCVCVCVCGKKVVFSIHNVQSYYFVVSQLVKKLHIPSDV